MPGTSAPAPEIRPRKAGDRLAVLQTRYLKDLTNQQYLAIYDGTGQPLAPPERVHIERRYRDFDFPFAELPFPPLVITREWTAADLAGFLASWSAVDRYRQARGEDPIPAVAAELEALWGAGRRTVSWEMFGRIGRVEAGVARVTATAPAGG